MIWYFIYSAFFSVIMLISVPFLLILSVLTGRFREGLFNYFGIFPGRIVRALRNRKVVWVHSVAVGEIKAVTAVLRQMRGYEFFVTTTCSDGAELIKKAFPEAVAIQYFPLDIPVFIQAALFQICPCCVVIAETDYWPNFVRICRNKNIPVYVVNCRVSEKACRGYLKFREFSLAVHMQPVHFFCQSAPDAERLLKMGVPENNITVTGNTKLDDKLLPAKSGGKYDIFKNREVIVFGSTHEGEEKLIAEAICGLHLLTEAVFVVAPRNLDRVSEVASVFSDTGLKTVRWSEMKNYSGELIIVDTMGELASLYQYARIVFIGGSLVKKGCHNVFEPLLAGKPVVVGPDITNFRDICEQMQREECLFIADNTESLIKILEKLFNDDIIVHKIGNRINSFLASSQGLSKSIAERILSDI